MKIVKKKSRLVEAYSESIPDLQAQVIKDYKAGQIDMYMYHKAYDSELADMGLLEIFDQPEKTGELSMDIKEILKLAMTEALSSYTPTKEKFIEIASKACLGRYGFLKGRGTYGKIKEANVKLWPAKIAKRIWADAYTTRDWDDSPHKQLKYLPKEEYREAINNAIPEFESKVKEKLDAKHKKEELIEAAIMVAIDDFCSKCSKQSNFIDRNTIFNKVPIRNKEIIYYFKNNEGATTAVIALTFEDLFSHGDLFTEFLDPETESKRLVDISYYSYKDSVIIPALNRYDLDLKDLVLFNYKDVSSTKDTAFLQTPPVDVSKLDRIVAVNMITHSTSGRCYFSNEGCVYFNQADKEYLMGQKDKLGSPIINTPTESGKGSMGAVYYYEFDSTDIPLTFKRAGFDTRQGWSYSVDSSD